MATVDFDSTPILAKLASKGSILTTIAIFLVITVLKSVVKTRYFHPLSKFPGPFWASITRLWLCWINLGGHEHEILYELHKKYGPVVRITPTLLLVSDPKMLPVIYHRYADKADHYVTGSFGKNPSVFNLQPHAEHSIARKRVAQPYSFTAVKPMEANIDQRIVEWTEKLSSEFAEAGKKFDFAPWATYFAYDVISEIAFGKALGFISAGVDIDGLIQSFHEGLLLFGIMSRLHPLTKWIKNTWVGEKYIIPKPGDKSGIGNIMTFRDDLIEKRLKSNETSKVGRIDLLQNFLNAKNPDGTPMTMEEVKSEALLVLIAGSDTTATAFQALVIYVLQTPGVYPKLMSELDTKTAAGLLSAIPKFEEVQEHLPYAKACLREAMRLCPSAPSIFPRVVPKEGMTIFGKFAPEGMEVTCNPWTTHRNKELYGEDSEVYRPERWIEDPERVKEMDKYDFTWGFGTRVCLGKNIALMELYKAPVQFFRMFVPELVNKQKPCTYHNSGGVAYHTDLQITIRKRY